MGVRFSPPSILCSWALNIYVRGPRLWYNSFFTMTIMVLSPGCPKKNIVWFWTQGSKIKNSELSRGGGRFCPPSILCSGALNIYLRGQILWYNSFFIMTIKALGPGNLKGVPKKLEYDFGHRSKISKILNLSILFEIFI